MKQYLKFPIYTGLRKMDKNKFTLNPGKHVTRIVWVESGRGVFVRKQNSSDYLKLL